MPGRTRCRRQRKIFPAPLSYLYGDYALRAESELYDTARGTPGFYFALEAPSEELDQTMNAHWILSRKGGGGVSGNHYPPQPPHLVFGSERWFRVFEGVECL